MFFYLSKILKTFLSPFTWLVVFLIFYLFTGNRVRKKRFLWLTLATLFLFSNPFITNQIVKAWEIAPYNAEYIREPYDVGILLGGSLLSYDTVTNRPVYSLSVDRLLQTIELYKKGKIKKILLSGGSGSITKPKEKEADIIKQTLLLSGILADDILLESDSRNTYENAFYSRAVLDREYPNGNYLLITSAFHMRRTVACFEKAGLQSDPFPVDPRSHPQSYTLDQLIVPNSYEITLWEMLFHEWIGMISYWVAGYI